ncbi:hypothetical protein EGR_10279 [Echinococcus granulosus]|uniref:Uncharacterized protein n=1 Tax=Echinococcus granulosus TaxID=6210 RepID=W6U2S5_ECHGR|nr:hypothetical protein EGR_10279 [Echinococcus granulosus]EUB54861.1 hypothetical protein EGR_10279 [Echinococcus granulosus]
MLIHVRLHHHPISSLLPFFPSISVRLKTVGALGSHVVSKEGHHDVASTTGFVCLGDQCSRHCCVNENLIHGEKALKRGHLEAWLEVQADHTLYCVESEDKVYVDRAAKACEGNTD